MSRYDLILYHAKCLDGFCAAFIAKAACPAAELRPVSYGTPPPPVANRRVLIVDFSYPRQTLIDMAKSSESLTILDHHKTSQADLQDLPFTVFDLTKSGARLTWEHFNKARQAPWLVSYTEDRDLWKWTLPYSQEINAALESYPMTVEAWQTLLSRSMNEMIEEGEVVLRYRDQLLTRILSEPTQLSLGDWTVPAVNTAVLQSEAAGKLAEQAPFGVAWFQREDGQFVLSLRASRPDAPDVSEIAKRLGGGGHPRAAGCVLPALPSIQPLFHCTEKQETIR